MIRRLLSKGRFNNLRQNHKFFFWGGVGVIKWVEFSKWYINWPLPIGGGGTGSAEHTICWHVNCWWSNGQVHPFNPFWANFPVFFALKTLEKYTYGFLKFWRSRKLEHWLKTGCYTMLFEDIVFHTNILLFGRGSRLFRNWGGSGCN